MSRISIIKYSHFLYFLFERLEPVKSTITISTSKTSPKKAAEMPKQAEPAKPPQKVNTTPTVAPSKPSPKKVDSPKPVDSPKSTTMDKPTSTPVAPTNQSNKEETTAIVNGVKSKSRTPTPTIPASLNLIKNDKGLLPKAMIKPNVLTHILEGHMVHEATEPFPMSTKRLPDDVEDAVSPKRSKSSPEKPATTPDRTICIQCGKKDSKGKLKHKPYCSKTCSKAAKAGVVPTAKQNGEHKLRIRNENGTTNGSVSPKSLPSPTSTNGTSSDSSSSGSSSDMSSIDAKKSAKPPTPMEVSADVDAEQEEPISFLVKWSVDEVCDYIRSLPGYGDYADDFANHEIDGQALVLLNENHLVKTMNIKLGPALKIMSQIEAIKLKGAQQAEAQQTQ